MANDIQTGNDEANQDKTKKVVDANAKEIAKMLQDNDLTFGELLDPDLSIKVERNPKRGRYGGAKVEQAARVPFSVRIEAVQTLMDAARFFGADKKRISELEKLLKDISGAATKSSKGRAADPIEIGVSRERMWNTTYKVENGKARGSKRPQIGGIDVGHLLTEEEVKNATEASEAERKIYITYFEDRIVITKKPMKK